MSNTIDKLLLYPMKRDDIEGKDEDLSAVEEFYLREIEQTANADMLQRVKK